MKTKPTAIIFLFSAAIIWGFAFGFQTLAANHITAYAFNGARFLLGSLTLIPLILIFEREKLTKKVVKNNLIPGTFAGIFLFIASALQMFGIQLTGDSGKSSFLTGLYIVLVPIIYFLFFKRRTALSTWIGAVFAVVGLFLLSVNEKMTIELGDALLILGAVFWAMHIITIDRFSDRISALKFSMTQNAVCALLNIIFALIFERGSFSFAGIVPAFSAILYCGILSSGIAYTCQILGQKGANPTFSTIVLSTESVFGAIAGAIMLGERMSARGYMGCILIFAGIILSQIDIISIIRNNRKEKVI